MQNLYIDVEANHKYEIKFWGVDEEMTNTFSQPNFAANIKVLNSQQAVLFSEKLIINHSKRSRREISDP